MRAPFTILVALICLSLTNCINNTEDITGGIPISPETVSYIEDVQPIFNGSCGGGNCHITSSTNGVNLSSHNAVINSVGSSYGTAIVVAGQPDQSPLVDKIEPRPDIGGRMPSGGGNLTPDEINTIRAWIEGGAENN